MVMPMATLVFKVEVLGDVVVILPMATTILVYLSLVIGLSVRFATSMVTQHWSVIIGLNLTFKLHLLSLKVICSHHILKHTWLSLCLQYFHNLRSSLRLLLPYLPLYMTPYGLQILELLLISLRTPQMLVTSTLMKALKGFK